MNRIIGIVGLLALASGAAWTGLGISGTGTNTSAAGPSGIPPGVYKSPDGTEAVIARGAPDLLFSVVIGGTFVPRERRVEMELRCQVRRDGAITCPVSSNSVDAMDLMWYEWAYHEGRITRTHPDSGDTVAFVKE